VYLRFPLIAIDMPIYMASNMDTEQDSGLIPSVFGESAGFRMDIVNRHIAAAIGFTVQLSESSATSQW
jgi:hypothetical protein